MTSERDELIESLMLSPMPYFTEGAIGVAAAIRREIDRRIEAAIQAERARGYNSEWRFDDETGRIISDDPKAELDLSPSSNSAAAASQFKAEPSSEDSGVATAADLCVCGHARALHNSRRGCHYCMDCDAYRPAPPQAKDDLPAKLEAIAEIIGRRPVLGHWPHMRAHLDIEAIEQAAARIRELEQLNKDHWAEIAALQARVKELDTRNLTLIGENFQLIHRVKELEGCLQ
jgi:hypothetical protein